MTTKTTPTDSALVQSLEDYFGRYVVLREGLALVAALWSIATYLAEDFDTFAYLAVTSPTKRCGKSTFGDLLRFVVARGRSTVGITPAALFRIIERDRPTLIIDEAEVLRTRSDKSNDLREVLNCGYRKGQSVIRCEGKKYEPREFRVFGPKVIILIGRMSDTIADRCIPIQMDRRNGQRVESFRSQQVEAEAKELKSQIEAWTANHRQAVKDWYAANTITCVTDREAELWTPLFAICSLATPERVGEMESIARRLAQVKGADEPTDWGIKLLEDLRIIFDKEGKDRAATEYLLQELLALEESPWREWSNGRGLNARGLAKLLKDYEIYPRSIRFRDGEAARGYPREQFDDAWQRYLPQSSRDNATEAVNIEENDDLPSAT